MSPADAVVIGGGFYGCAVAAYLKTQRGFGRVVLLERETDLLRRSSLNNQARVHSGYHYPRSFTTAFRSRANLPRFVTDYHDIVKRNFSALYAIARRNSKVNRTQFRRFCSAIAAPLQPAPPALRSLFQPKLIEDVFLVEEFGFDVDRLRAHVKRDLANSGVEVRLELSVDELAFSTALTTIHMHEQRSARSSTLTARYAFNCTYSGLNRLSGDAPRTVALLEHEITEMALIKVPAPLQNLAVTVMDGPFFSVTPFPSRETHALSHVRYTPHLQWMDSPTIDPYKKLCLFPKSTRFEWMIRDAARYLPVIRKSTYEGSIFEVKTVLTKNETDDGRPILFERHPSVPHCYSILGGKIDNIYDIFERLDREPMLR